VKKVSFADRECSLARSLDIVGEWWTLLIVRDAFLGVTRFDDFVDRLGIARNVLTARLDTLVEAGVLDKVPYEEGNRTRYDYRLTEMGRDLFPVVTALRQWGDRWVVGEGHEPLLLQHRTCGEVVHGVFTCDHCGEPLVPRDAKAIAGPGLSNPEELLSKART
jgi:DNA-binding HxlR family transcriptional regulator